MTRRSYTSKQGASDAPQREFDLDDVTWVCEGDISVLDLSEYARLATQGVDSDSPEGMAILADVYSGLLGGSYQKFREHCRKNGTGSDVLVNIIGDLITDAADRPTNRPSDSSDGPTNDADTVTVVSFSRNSVEQREKEEKEEKEETPQVISYG
jgi:hypothetical protein